MSKPARWKILDEIIAAVPDNPNGFLVPFNSAATLDDLKWYQKRVAKCLPNHEVTIDADIAVGRFQLKVVPVSSEAREGESKLPFSDSSDALAQG